MAAALSGNFFPLFVLIWVAFPLLGMIPFWVGLSFGALVFLAVLKAMGRNALKADSLFRFGMLPAAGLILLQYRTLFQYQPLLALVLLFAAFKIAFRRNVRDLRLSAMMMVLLVAGGTLTSATIIMKFHIVISFLWIGMLLLETSRGDGAFCGFGPAAMQVLTYFLAALPVILFVYLFFPRYEEAFFSIYRFKGYGRTGISGEVYPGSIERIVEDETPVFRAFVDRPVNMEQLYWRVLTLSYTDGGKWRQSILDRRPHDAKANPALKGRGVRQEILLDPLLNSYLVGLDVPCRVTLLSQRSVQAIAAGAQTFRLDEALRSRLTYRVDSAGHRNPALDDPQEKIYRWVPGEFSSAVQTLTAKWKKESRSDMEYLQKILQYFARHLHYTLTPGAYDLRQPFLDQLLFTVKSGFCEHFASAFALLARDHGIPARLVAGYHGGAYNPHGRYWIVRQKNAHVWTEVFVKEKGWLRIDPTAYVDPERIRTGRYGGNTAAWLDRLPFYSKLQGLALLLDGVNTRWYQLQSTFSLSLREKLSQSRIAVTLQRHQLILGGALGAAAAVYLLMLAYPVATLRWKKRDLDAEAVRIYKKVLGRLEKQKVFKAPFEGPLTLLARLEKKDGALAADLAPFIHFYLDVRYGPGETTPVKLKQLRNLSRGCSREKSQFG